MYEGTCSCGTNYIGITDRNASLRFDEHNNPKKNSEPAKHIKLDYEITMDEVKLGAYILYNGKATGHDIISNEMLMSLLNMKPEAIKALNVILQHPTVIPIWNTSMIVPIHKKGPKMNPENYRGISLLS